MWNQNQGSNSKDLSNRTATVSSFYTHQESTIEGQHEFAVVGGFDTGLILERYLSPSPITSTRSGIIPSPACESAKANNDATFIVNNDTTFTIPSQVSEDTLKPQPRECEDTASLSFENFMALGTKESLLYLNNIDSSVDAQEPLVDDIPFIDDNEILNENDSIDPYTISHDDTRGLLSSDHSEVDDDVGKQSLLISIDESAVANKWSSPSQKHRIQAYLQREKDSESSSDEEMADDENEDVYDNYAWINSSNQSSFVPCPDEDENEPEEKPKWTIGPSGTFHLHEFIDFQEEDSIAYFSPYDASLEHLNDSIQVSAVANLDIHPLNSFAQDTELLPLFQREAFCGEDWVSFSGPDDHQSEAKEVQHSRKYLGEDEIPEEEFSFQVQTFVNNGVQLKDETQMNPKMEIQNQGENEVQAVHEKQLKDETQMNPKMEIQNQGENEVQAVHEKQLKIAILTNTSAKSESKEIDQSKNLSKIPFKSSFMAKMNAKLEKQAASKSVCGASIRKEENGCFHSYSWSNNIDSVPLPSPPVTKRRHNRASPAIIGKSEEDVILSIPPAADSQEPAMTSKPESDPPTIENANTYPTPSPLRFRAKQLWQKKQRRVAEERPDLTLGRISASDLSEINPNEIKLKPTKSSSFGDSDVDKYVPKGMIAESTHQDLPHSAENRCPAVANASPARATVDSHDHTQHFEALFKKKTLGTAKAVIAAELTARKFEGLYGRAYSNSSSNSSLHQSFSSGDSSVTSSPILKNGSRSHLVQVLPPSYEVDSEADSPRPSPETEAIPPQHAENDVMESRDVKLPQHVASSCIQMDIRDSVRRDKEDIKRWFCEYVFPKRDTSEDNINSEVNLSPNIMTLEVVNSLITYVSGKLRVLLYIDKPNIPQAEGLNFTNSMGKSSFDAGDGTLRPTFVPRTPMNKSTARRAAMLHPASKASPAGSRLSVQSHASSAPSNGTIGTSGAQSLQAEWGSPMIKSSSSSQSVLQPIERIDSMNSTTDPTLLPSSISPINAEALVQSFLEWMVRISLHTEVPCPAVVDSLLLEVTSRPKFSSFTGQCATGNGFLIFRDMLFATEDLHVVPVLSFFRDACITLEGRLSGNHDDDEDDGNILNAVDENEIRGSIVRLSMSSSKLSLKGRRPNLTLYLEDKSNFILPKYFTPPPKGSGPSPAEMVLIYKQPQLLFNVFSYIGCPATLCKFKQVKSSFRRYIHRHQQRFFKTAVRVGGMPDEVRPKFWLWITLIKCREDNDELDTEDLDTPNAFVKKSSAQNSTTSEHVGVWQSRNYSYDAAHPDHRGWEGIIGQDKLEVLEEEDVVARWDQYSRSFTETELGEACITETQSHGTHALIHHPHPRDDFSLLEQIGREGKWHNVISRDVSRAFGTLPPHKTSSFRRRDSVVRVLAKLRRSSSTTNASGRSLTARTPTPSKTGWDTSLRCIIENAEFSSSHCRLTNEKDDDLSSEDSVSIPESELVLSGVHPQGCKEEMQGQLAAILHALAATYDSVGYCQGMDYLVCHLMRILMNEILTQARSGTLPPLLSKYNGIKYTSQSNLVEETIFLVMDTMFSYYGLRHMYWPELRCLKRACKVFERLVARKLPVLADHFDHHDLNVGIFALGWFQTLFLYLPNMPSATVCHMWDIWFVERNFKIFFRAATAILFLSQPTLLNQEYDGMMVYLNTFPDSTLLAPDILMDCALNIKVTNRMLAQIEKDLLREGLIY